MGGRALLASGIASPSMPGRQERRKAKEAEIPDEEGPTIPGARGKYAEECATSDVVREREKASFSLPFLRERFVRRADSKGALGVRA